MTRRRAAFTLVELLIALVIFLIAFIGTGSIMYANRRNLVIGSTERLATWDAIGTMENIKATAYDDLANSTASVSLGGVTATRTVTVQTVTESGAEYKRVTVSVAWAGQQVSLVTYVAEIAKATP